MGEPQESLVVVLRSRNSERKESVMLKRYGLMALMLLLFLLLVACRESAPTEPPDKNVDGGSEEIEAKEAGQEVSGEPVESRGDVAEAAPNGSTGAQESVVPSSIPTAQKEIEVCIGGPSPGLYMYEDESLAAVAVRHAIYENLFTVSGYKYQAQGLEKMPSLADGDAVIETITVNEGDQVIDATGKIVLLRDGVTVKNTTGEAIRYQGTPVQMEQLVVDFRFRPMVWSDGTPVTAEDSVFSFQLASDPQTAFRNNLVAHTESYVATGEHAVRWTGLPGYKDQSYFTNVWTPLPRHQLATEPASELKQAERTNKLPLSSGPFVVREWTAENELVLDRNPHYYRQTEGLPIIDSLVIRFGNGEDFLAGDTAVTCDVFADGALRLGNLPLVEMASESGDWEVQTVPGDVFEHIAFGINPVEEYAEGQPDWFEDVRVRQAITMCTDRQRMVDELTGGRAEVLNAYVPEGHPLYPDDLEVWNYDPVGANAILDEAGYLDFADDGRRQDVKSGVPMTITLGTNSESSLRLRISEIFQENMLDCGIPVETYDLPAGTWYAEGPIGRLFGRRFDLAAFAWLARALPDCGLYLSANITGPEEGGFGGWENTNVTGWSSAEFDATCGEALEALPGGAGYEEKQQEALRIFARELPAIPLFTNLKIAATRPGLRNVVLDSAQPSLLWNIGQWDVEE